MTDHDPMCSPDSLYGDDAEDEFCHCELAALIRADEREQYDRAMFSDYHRDWDAKMADLRAKVMEKRERWMDEDGDEAAGRRMTYNEMLDLLDGSSE